MDVTHGFARSHRTTREGERGRLSRWDSEAPTPRWLVRFGYDGSRLDGWARQPGHHTVEGELRAGLRAFGFDLGSLELEVASRTDRGVSARANALVLRTDLPGTTLLRSLNGVDPGLFFTAAAPVPEDFRVRHAIRRTYRYFDASIVRDPARRREAVRLFAGEVDVRSLGRAIPSTQPMWRRIEAIAVDATPDGAVVEVRAQSFVWGMVRKIVGALWEVDAGRLSLARLQAALEGKVRLTLPMAEPEPLVLWDVEYSFPWTVFWRGPNRPQRGIVDHRRAELWARAQVLKSLNSVTAPDAEGP
jgi:tRNA pseudouridine38-40 synthase